MITEFLRFESMVVTAVASLAEAREALARLPLDALVSDLRLPDGDGCDLIAGLRASSSPNRDIPAIGITAHPESENRARSLAAGFDEFLPKISTATLARRLTELCAKTGAVKLPRSPRA